eukprot:jgi/Sobl393_1/8839/SZX73313.1
MAAEISQADAAVQSLLNLQQQQAAPAAGAAGLQTSGDRPQPRRSMDNAAVSTTKCVSEPNALASVSTAGDAAAKAAALHALGIDSDICTPELLASLAMRFQAFNLPPGLNSMPDLGTIALAVQQQEQQAAQQRQQQQEEWRLQQQRQQLARQNAANRHLQLYQLGVVQQRARLQQGSSMAGPACLAAASGGPHLQPALQHQQQPCDATCTGTTGAVQQQQQQEEVACEQGLDTMNRHVRFSSAGQDAAAGGASDAAYAAQPAAEAITPASAPAAAGAAATQVAMKADVDGATGVAGSCCDGMATANNRQQSRAERVSDNAATSQQQQQLTSNTSQPQQATNAATCRQAAAAAPCSNFTSSVARPALLQQLLPGQAGMPPQRRYKSDVPGAPAGASHGHLSPAGLTLNHLPGSRRQVYARIQDALACSDAISRAEQSLRALSYAPCARPAAAGST